MFHIREKAKRTVKRAGLLTGGLLLCTVGIGFLTVAAWLALVPTVGVQTAATIIAAAYLGSGLILVGLATASSGASGHRSEQHTKNAAAAPSDGPPIMQAFMYGLQAGAQADQKRHNQAHP